MIIENGMISFVLDQMKLFIFCHNFKLPKLFWRILYMRSFPGVKRVVLCAICDRGAIIRGRLSALELDLNLLF